MGTVTTEDLKPGMVIRTTINDDVTGRWVEYTEDVEVIEVHHGDAHEKYLPWTGRTIRTTHPQWETGRDILYGEARPWSEYEVIH